ncbi:hypothetical protein [Frankia sp. AgB32]|uniref:hypothetical protein n=1 Tax=Frankia sp. AgB32 TaxID=631119 RepID=UPI0020101727|nr:hypothetical protein [Frankia sp. AgB32]MCK9898372.1 hypothetical protein [Frankia sp. AgB32]
MTSWADTRRANQAAAAEQNRLDKAADRAEARADAAAAAVLDRDSRSARQAARATRRAARSAWRSAHAVELLIYPLAVVSALMAIPAMALYGLDLYDNPTGLALPLLSELGVWAFAMAVLVSRRRHPDRPTAMLSAGVVLFGAVAFGLNLAHGLATGGLVTGLVMGVVSVAGVIAHQLAVASPPRSRADRAAARHAHAAARRVDHARRLATRHAVVALADDGTARLVYTPGTYTPRRRRLVPIVVPGLAVADPWDAALADLDPDGGPVESVPADPITEPDQHESGPETGGGGVDLADPPPTTSRPAPRRPIDPMARRKTDRADAVKAARRLAKRQRRPLTADQIRTELHIAPGAAREIRDQINTELFPDQ